MVVEQLREHTGTYMLLIAIRALAPRAQHHIVGCVKLPQAEVIEQTAGSLLGDGVGERTYGRGALPHDDAGMRWVIPQRCVFTSLPGV